MLPAEPKFSLVAELNELLRDDLAAPATRRASRSKRSRAQNVPFPLAASVLLVSLGVIAFAGSRLSRNGALDQPAGVNPSTVAEQIVCAESGGNSKAKNTRSSASGAAQFLDETWLRMVRKHRRDLAQLGDKEVLQLRQDAKLAGEITARLVERNAEILRRRELPVTPATLYLSHFAGDAGAVALLQATDADDAASVMARADVTGQTKREKLVKANPFLDGFTVDDIKNWADKKMRFRALSCRSPRPA